MLKSQHRGVPNGLLFFAKNCLAPVIPELSFESTQVPAFTPKADITSLAVRSPTALALKS
jgi:hypothetical protein